MTKILVISFTDLERDPRVNRQIRFLCEEYQVISVGLASPNIASVGFISILKPVKSLFLKIKNLLQLLFRRYEEYYWQQSFVIQCLEKLSTTTFDVVIANDIDTLPLALKIADKAKVIFDAHEYAPRQFDDQLYFRIFFQGYRSYLCKTYIPQVDGMMTVCQSIADTYCQDTGVTPVVVTNAPIYQELQPRLRDEHHSIIRLVHHGQAIQSRYIETMIRIMDYLDEKFELNLLLVQASEAYFQYLKKLASSKSNIHFLDPVPMQELPQYLNQFDIGIHILKPVNFNHRYALPNKFFEFIQARLALAIGPSPEMASIVQEHDCGVISKSFSPKDIAASLMELDHQKINYYKQQSHKIAHQMSAQKNREVLLELVESTLRNH